MNDAIGICLLLLAVSPFLLYVLDWYDRKRVGKGALSLLPPHQGRRVCAAHVSRLDAGKSCCQAGCEGVVEGTRPETARSGQGVA